MQCMRDIFFPPVLAGVLSNRLYAIIMFLRSLYFWAMGQSNCKFFVYGLKNYASFDKNRSHWYRMLRIYPLLIFVYACAGRS